jgi:hypothetical protein
MKESKRVLFFILTVLVANSFAQQADSLKKNEHFELSFGQSLLFISSSRLADIHNQAAIVVPTNAMLFFAEFRPQKFIKIPVFFNLPTETKQFLVNGQLVSEKASPTFGTGLEFRIFQAKIDSKSKIELEVGPLASFIFDTKNNVRIAPILAGRFRIMRGENFVMYLGASYSFGIEAIGLLYGTGTIF